MRERIYSVVGRVLEVPAGDLTAESSPETVATWESLRHMRLVLALEDEFGVQFTDEQIMEMVDVGTICATVSGMIPS